jgi:antitoxin ParD1/3/4
MQRIDIFLPEHLKQFIDAQISQGCYSDASEYMMKLILADRERVAEDQLEALLLEGMEGSETVMEAADWDEIRKEARAHLDQAKK